MSDTSLTKVRDHQLRFDLPPGVVGDATSFRVGLVDNFDAWNWGVWETWVRISVIVITRIGQS